MTSFKKSALAAFVASAALLPELRLPHIFYPMIGSVVWMQLLHLVADTVS